jgi:hypothetical protein
VRRPIFALVVLLAAVMSAGTGAGAPNDTRTIVLTDPDTHQQFRIETGVGNAERGLFALTVPGVGVFLGTGPAAIKEASAVSSVITYDGAGRLVAASGTSSVALTLRAQIDPTSGLGQADVTTPTAKYHVVARRSLPNAAHDAVVAFERAMAAADWTALYALLSTELRSAMTAAEFSASAASQTATLGRIVSVARTSESAVTLSPLGMRYVVATYDIVRRSAAGDAARKYEAWFLEDADGWRLWFTAQQ